MRYLPSLYGVRFWVDNLGYGISLDQGTLEDATSQTECALMVMAYETLPEDMDAVAFWQGYDAELAGLSIMACPFCGSSAVSWVEGYCQAREDDRMIATAMTDQMIQESFDYAIR